MKETIRLIQLFQKSINSLQSGCVVFSDMKHRFIGEDSDGGHELTLEELKELRACAEHLEYQASRFVSLCDFEVQKANEVQVESEIS